MVPERTRQTGSGILKSPDGLSGKGFDKLPSMVAESPLVRKLGPVYPFRRWRIPATPGTLQQHIVQGYKIQVFPKPLGIVLPGRHQSVFRTQIQTTGM